MLTAANFARIDFTSDIASVSDRGHIGLLHVGLGYPLFSILPIHLQHRELP